MKLEHVFAVPVGVDDAWMVLLDIERVAQCMPGAVLESIDEGEFSGSVKIKLGPISMSYQGSARFTTKDSEQHRLVMDATARDDRGNSSANAEVTISLTADDASSTTVSVLTDLDLTGKPAQFGSGVIGEVGNRIINQFADTLAATIAEEGVGPSIERSDATSKSGQEFEAAGPATQRLRAGPRVVAESEPLDAMALIGSVAKGRAGQLAIVAGVGVLLLFLGVIRRRNSVTIHLSGDAVNSLRLFSGGVR